MREQLQELVDRWHERGIPSILWVLAELKRILATEPPAVSVPSIHTEWIRAIGKAASALRFSADNWEWHTEPAKAELRDIASKLSELEVALIDNKQPAVSVKAGWVCKDDEGVWWHDTLPYWTQLDEKWQALTGCHYVWITSVVTDPWPDKVNGGPECIMEVKP